MIDYSRFRHRVHLYVNLAHDGRCSMARQQARAEVPGLAKSLLLQYGIINWSRSVSLTPRTVAFAKKNAGLWRLCFWLSNSACLNAAHLSNCNTPVQRHLHTCSGCHLRTRNAALITLRLETKNSHR